MSDKKEETHKSEQNDLCLNGSLIVHLVFQALEKEPVRYSLETNDGLIHLKELAERLADENVHSFRGTFQQAKLAGVCIASGWLEDNQSLSFQQKTEALISLENVLNTSEYNKLQQFMNTHSENTIERSLIFGFRCGARLGVMIRKKFRKSKKYPFITTDYLLKCLEKKNQKGIAPAYLITTAKCHPAILFPHSREKTDN